ncbi:Cell shape-determining protein MreC [bacterium HR11]|nr:Cell shape-determining protein MreC [bacterium HR11]
MADLGPIVSRRWLFRQWLLWTTVCWALLSVQVLNQRGISLGFLVQQWVWTPVLHEYERVYRQVQDWRDRWRTMNELAEENRRLRAEVFRYQQMERQYEQVLQEMALLKPLYERWQARRPSSLWARVVLPDVHAIRWHQIVIDRGSRHGVHQYAAVSTPDGLVGYVESVGSTTSQVRLVSHPFFRCGARVGTDGPMGVLYGQGNVSRVLLRYVPQGSVVPPGSPVYTSGIEGVLPAGLRVGWVEASRTSDTGEVLYEVRPAVVPSQVSWVIVDVVGVTPP